MVGINVDRRQFSSVFAEVSGDFAKFPLGAQWVFPVTTHATTGNRKGPLRLYVVD